MGHAHCTLNAEGFKHILRIYNTYRLSIATMVARKFLSVTLYVHCLYLLVYPDDNKSFDVLLTVHLSIILVINQLNAQIPVL